MNMKRPPMGTFQERLRIEEQGVCAMTRIEKSRIRAGALLAGTNFAGSGLAGAQKKNDKIHSQKDGEAGIRVFFQGSQKKVWGPTFSRRKPAKKEKGGSPPGKI